ncbi:phosphoribosyl transferase [Alteromonas portus]|uniref:Phosphoribosyl transferase n=1 Tax=Alteromonas portus TaxID=2565549 RepID=A0A4U0ZIT7_9ALTE|nr:phosphoribosyl transferase [Alteromonas portus]TKB01992.1 phosphoribosyl transferase [Alteromonas portus]
MAKLKGIILSVVDTLLNQGDIDQQVFTEVEKLMAYLKLRGIKPVLLANQPRVLTSKDGSKRDLYDALEEKFDDLEIITRVRDSAVPSKPQKAVTEYVLKKMGWQSNEVVYLGSSDDDMRTSINGGLLFLRATWFNNNTDYGFEFSEPKEVARFIDTLCLRDHFWSHEIIDGDFEYYALAPFSTYRPDLKNYSEHAREAAKFGRGQVDFWLGALVTSLYFTGIHQRIDYVTAYPGHKRGYGNQQMDDDLRTFGKCFRKAYLHDLIIRHTTATKLQHARIRREAVDHHTQINTIKLNRSPQKNQNGVYTNPPVKRGKTVLLVDDFCTGGLSLDSGRKFIEQTGAKTILVTWLKTINTDYQTIGDMGEFNPYEENHFTDVPTGKSYNYHHYLVDHDASNELGGTLARYVNWDWPQ